MEEVKEDVEIVIKETPSGGTIKEMGFSINTGQSGSAEFVSAVINGELGVIMMSSDKQVSVEISFDEFDDVVLLNVVNFSGRKYLPLRVSGMVNSGENISGSSEKWVLNNRLRFRVKGPFNSNVNFLMRWK